MKLMRIYRDIIREDYSDLDQTYYHGTNDPNHKFATRGKLANGSFFTADFDNAKFYGNYVIIVNLNPNLKIFDATDEESATKLFDEFGSLINKYYLNAGAAKQKRYKISSPDKFINAKEMWGYIESTDGVLDWIQGHGYDGIFVTEDSGNIENIFLFSPITSKIEILDVHDVMRDGDEL